jgi:hypothetical protein
MGYDVHITRRHQGADDHNSKDFDSPEIVDELSQFNCPMIPRFDHGYRFLQSRLPL